MQSGFSGAETAAIVAVVGCLKEQAAALPEGSRVRACLLAIRSNLIRAHGEDRLTRRQRRRARRARACPR